MCRRVTRVRVLDIADAEPGDEGVDLRITSADTRTITTVVLFRTNKAVLSSSTVELRVVFVYLPGARNGVAVNENGSLVVAQEVAVDAPLWQVNTLESTVSRWDTGTTPPQERGRYRVGLPGGECAGNVSPFTAGCNNPSRVAVDNTGDVYVASAGYDMQGTVTKIATDVSRCVDRNGNNVIDTPAGGDVKATARRRRVCRARSGMNRRWSVSACGGCAGLRCRLRSLVVGTGDADPSSWLSMAWKPGDSRPMAIPLKPGRRALG